MDYETRFSLNGLFRSDAIQSDSCKAEYESTINYINQHTGNVAC